MITYVGATNISENTQFAKFVKYNSTPKFVDLQYLKTYPINPTKENTNVKRASETTDKKYKKYWNVTISFKISKYITT